MYLVVLKSLRTIRLWIVTLVCFMLFLLLKYKADVYENVVRNVLSRSTRFALDHETTYFLKYWSLQRKRRFDYSSILKPCEVDLKWLPYYPHRNASFITSAKTSRVALNIKPTGQYSKILITSYNVLNTRKWVGGDSWRVLVHGTTSVPVTKVDNLDGTYEMSFLITKAGRYKVELCLEYTMCDGYKDPPHDWFTRGNEQGKGQHDSVLPGYEKPYMEERYDGNLTFVVEDSDRNILQELLPSLENTYYPSCLMWDGFGWWNTTLQWNPYLPKAFMESWKHTKHHYKGLLWIYGDSVGDFFFRAIWNTPLCKTLFKTCKRSYNWVYVLPNGKPPRTLTFPYDNKDFEIDRVKRELVEVLLTLSINPESVLLLNLGLHYAMGISMKTYMILLDSMIDVLLEYQNTYNVTVIWKTSTALQKWKFGTPESNARHAKSHRFLTQQRNDLFNAISTRKFCDAGFAVLDVQALSLSYPNGTGTVVKPWDAVHYDRTAFLSVEQYLTDYFSATS